MLHYIIDYLDMDDFLLIIYCVIMLIDVIIVSRARKSVRLVRLRHNPVPVPAVKLAQKIKEEYKDYDR